MCTDSSCPFLPPRTFQVVNCGSSCEGDSKVYALNRFSLLFFTVSTTVSSGSALKSPHNTRGISPDISHSVCSRSRPCWLLKSAWCFFAFRCVVAQKNSLPLAGPDSTLKRQTMATWFVLDPLDLRRTKLSLDTR